MSFFKRKVFADSSDEEQSLNKRPHLDNSSNNFREGSSTSKSVHIDSNGTNGKKYSDVQKRRRCRFVSEGSSSSDDDVCKNSVKENSNSTTSKYFQDSNSTPKKISGPRSSVDVKKQNAKKEKVDIFKLEKKLKEDSEDEEEDEDRINESKRQQVLTFFQESSIEELNTLTGCSSKSAENLIRLRPYTSWDDLVNKLDNAKQVGRKLIWNCLDILLKRKYLCKMMETCSEISNRLESELNSFRDTTNESPRKKAKFVLRQPENIPKSLSLKPYQIVGLNWIALLHRNKVNGVLADEMGLGKTIQTISFLAHLKESGNYKTHAIIVPSSTLDNWIREFEIWCPSITILVYRGSPNERRYIRQGLLKHQMDCDVILTTYNLAVSSPEDRMLFRKMGICYAVYDEGHMLKNMSSQRFQHLMKFNAERRLLLTGTPLQNNLLELMSLLRFVMPDMFNDKSSTLVKIFSTTDNDPSSSYEKKRIEHAKQIMKPFILRRFKNDVLHQLPAKEENLILCNMVKKQTEIYTKVKKTFSSKSLKSQMPRNELKNVYMELRKIANHPLLRRENYSDSILKEMVQMMKMDERYYDCDDTCLFEDMQVMTDFELHNLCCGCKRIKSFSLSDDVILSSGKFQELDILIPRIKQEGNRLLVFSQFTMMMDIIEFYLRKRNYKFLRLDGDTKVSDRLDLVDTFNNDDSYFVFILSTKAGGLGINLTSASVVILHDIDVNPYNDKQAEDRCHRLGQTKKVEIIKLISKDSIEEIMYKIAQNKLKLEKDITESDKEEIDFAELLKESLL